MNNNILELISNIDSKNNVESEKIFNSIIMDKISNSMDNMRKDIAHNMFSEAKVEDTSELDEVLDLDIEDYSLEDLEEFMVSEEFEQLDEISGKLLGTYIQKARTNAKAKFDHGIELDKDPKVAAIKAKVSDWYNDRRYKDDGRSIHRSKIDKGRQDIEARKKKIDPDYPKSTQGNKRHSAIDRAIKKLQYGKLTNEEALEILENSQLDELSKKTLGSYIQNAATSAIRNQAMATSGETKYYDDSSEKGVRKVAKRISGINKATNKLTKEEVDQSEIDKFYLDNR